MKRNPLVAQLTAVALLMMTGNTFAKDTHTYGTFILFSVQKEWGHKSGGDKKQGVQEAKAVMESFKDKVIVDAYWTLGLTNASHFLLRLHSDQMHHNQNFLTSLLGTSLGRHLEISFTISGVTKGLNYAPQFPALLEKLKAAKYEGPSPRYAIMIPTRKDSAWWNLPKSDRVKMIKEHTESTLPYLQTVKRKLYHATGLADADFITIFETDRLVDFNNLLIALRKVKEDKHNVRLGSPTVLGTIKPVSEVLNLLSQ